MLERDVFDFGLGAAGGNNIGQVAPQRGFTASQPHFARAALGEGGGDGLDFGQGKLIGLGFALVAVGQAVAASVVAEVGYGEAQVGELAVVGVY